MSHLLILLFLFASVIADEPSYMQEVKQIRNSVSEKKGTDNKNNEITILNVSYDPTREFFEVLDERFAKYWKEKTGQEVTVNQSHGGSGSQARAVMEGLEADVVALALAYDIDAIAQKNLIVKNWKERLPNNSVPFTSTVVFLVRKGNPKNIQNWDDLVKPNVAVITPNPKISGGARWNYLAAWAYAQGKFNNDESKILDFMKKLYSNVPILSVGARRSTTTFAQHDIGDVLITWENEAHLAIKEFGEDRFEIIRPKISIAANPPVALIDQNVKKKNTRDVADTYLKYLYSKEAQELAAQYFFRPIDPEVAAKYPKQFPDMKMVTIDEHFGGWAKAHEKHFGDGGTFDVIYIKK